MPFPPAGPTGTSHAPRSPTPPGPRLRTIGASVALILLVGALASCTCAKQPDKAEPDDGQLFAPRIGKVVKYEVQMWSKGRSKRKKSISSFDTTLVMTLTQETTPAGVPGSTLVGWEATPIAFIRDGKTQRAKGVLFHQATFDRLGRSSLVIETTKGGPQVVGRQTTIEAAVLHTQPVYSGGRPKVGASWEATRPIPVLTKAELPYRFRWRCTGEETRSGVRVLLIATTFEASGTAVQKDHYITSDAAGQQKGSGELVVDAKTLQTRDATVTFTSAMRFAVRELMSSTETSVTSRSRIVWHRKTR